MLLLECFAEFFHLLERRSYQAADANKDRLVPQGGLENRLARHHNAEVNHLETVARQHDADNVFTDVVHVAIGRGKHNARFLPPVSLFRSGGVLCREDGNSVLHHLSRTDNLWQEHLSFAKQDTDMFHRLHERTFDDLDGLTIFH